MRQTLAEVPPVSQSAATGFSGFSATSQFAAMEEGATTTVVATFLYARLHHFTELCQSLTTDETTSFVTEVRRLLTESVTKLGGEVAQRRPDSILAVFANKPDARRLDHAQRGLHAAMLLVHESVQLAQRMAQRSGAQELPTLTLAAGVHLGSAEVTPRRNGMVHAVGEAVEVARLLEVTATDLNWSIATSLGTRRAAAGRAEGGRIGSIGLPDDSFIDIVEVTGLVPRPGSSTPPRAFEKLRQALVVNQLARRRSASLPLLAPASGTGHFLIEGYRVLRKIGEGGMASIFLAQPAQEDSPPQVLKVMRLDRAGEADGLQRFIQEFALLAQVDHPNVARIFRQDFSVSHAYIAMEFFPRGDLRMRMKSPIDTRTAIRYIRQIAAGLAAIHAVGIVHRDLKPDNLMLRQDGSLALADFGVAKQVSMRITDTGDGDIVGTPYYLSPEQALGLAVDARCDIYSLGVLAFELLTGRKPYHATTAQELLNLHVKAPVPPLPSALAHLQPLLQKMMAKNREQRHASAQAVLDELARMGL